MVTCGAPQKIRFAVVGYTANLVRATPGASLSHLGTGRYYVRFNSSVATCAYIATVGDPGNAGVFAPAGVYTGSGPNAKHRLHRNQESWRRAPGWSPLPSGPHLPLDHWVALFGGTRDRHPAAGRRGQQLDQDGDGTVYGSANRNLNTCATVATQGSVNTAVPFVSATVEIVPGPNSRSAGIQVRKLLAFGGGFINQSFHAASVC